MKRFLRKAAKVAAAIVFLVVILVVGSGFVLTVSGFVQNKSAYARMRSEIETMSLGLENYQTDFGNYPQDAATDALDPRVDFDPVGGASGARYRAAGLTLYSALSGDCLPAGRPDGIPENKSYVIFRRDQLKFVLPGSGAVWVIGVQDPQGNSYGYSTVGYAMETQYRADLKSNSAVTRPSSARGYNSTFDLWSTTGETTGAGTNRWVRNWGN